MNIGRKRKYFRKPFKYSRFSCTQRRERLYEMWMNVILAQYFLIVFEECLQINVRLLSSLFRVRHWNWMRNFAFNFNNEKIFVVWNISRKKKEEKLFQITPTQLGREHVRFCVVGEKIKLSTFWYWKPTKNSCSQINKHKCHAYNTDVVFF